MPWLTPPSLPGDFVCMSLRLPNSPTLRQAVRGAILALTYTNNWEVGEGGLSAEDISAVMETAYFTLSQGCGLKPGDVIITASADTPDNRLECDGASYLAADYPLLFAAIGYTFGGSGANFNVPDLVDRAPIGEGNASGRSARTLGDTGGADEIALTGDELPNHYHTSHAHSTILLNGGVEAPVSVLVETPGNTGSAGSGQAFSLHAPFLVVRYTIVYQ